MSDIETVMTEGRLFPVPEAFARQATVSGMAQYEALCQACAAFGPSRRRARRFVGLLPVVLLDERPAEPAPSDR